jgi:hypothetical protein
MPKTTAPIVSLISGALLFFASTTWAQITPSDAKSFIGKREIVCGQVASANFATHSRGRPTFLNLDRPYPNQIFTVVIWDNKRALFPEAPDRAYRDKKICVTGTITTYRSVPQIVVDYPGQINAEK